MNTQTLIAELTCTTQLATEQDILAVEKMIGTSLTEQYRQFLTDCNGGRIGDPFSSGLWFDDQTSVKFIGDHHKEASYTLSYHYARFQDIPSPRISLDLIWIMTGEFGNHICLGIRGSNRGKIYFWDHDQEPAPDTWEGSTENSPSDTDCSSRKFLGTRQDFA